MFMQDLLGLQREMDRLYGVELFPEFSYKRYPLVNFFEKDDTLVVKAELAGLKKEDIGVELKDGCLKLAGKRESKPIIDGFFHRRERDSGSFERLFKLPYEIDPEKVRASYAEGILTVEMEKAQAAKGRTISVQ